MNAPEKFKDVSLPDVQAQEDTRALAIQKAGVRGIRYPIFVGTINELSDMANGGDFDGNRQTMFPCEHHTDQFFVTLLHNLGYDKNGNPLEE